MLGSRNLRANTRKEDSASIAETCFREVNDVNVCFNTCYLRKASEFCFAEDCFFYFWVEKIQEGKLVVQLEWEPPADCGGAPVASYEAYWAWPFDRQTEKALRNSEFTR